MMFFRECTGRNGKLEHVLELLDRTPKIKMPQLDGVALGCVAR